MKRPVLVHGLALLLSFSGCTCEYHAGSRRTYSTSGGEQVVVVQDPQGDLNDRIARDRREREAERQRERDRHPRRAGDPNKSIHVGAAPSAPSTGTGTPPRLGSAVSIGGEAPAPAPAPAPTPAPAPAPTTDPTAGVAAPAPAAPAPAPAPAPPAGDTYVRARNPTDRAPAAGGAGVVADPANNSKAPRRGTMGRKN